MMRFLRTKWAALSIGVILFIVTSWACLQPRKLVVRAAESLRGGQDAGLPPAGPSWNFQNPEMNEVLAQLQQERQSLDARKASLDALETRLKAEHEEIYSVTQTVWRLRTQLDSMITNIGEAELSNLKKLAKVYSSMAPDSAARILKEMDDQQIVKILAVMRETDSARILAILGQGTDADAKRAALISNRLRLTVAPTKKNP